MKTKLFALLGMSLLLAVSANAQSMVKANIPFDFVVDGRSLPAGAYVVQKVSDAALSIRTPDHQATLVLSQSCESLNAPAKSKLVFHQYGNLYFLSQIWVEGNNRGREFRKSAREIEVARDYSAKSVIIQAALR